MTTIKLITPEGKLGDEVKIWELKPDTRVSYFQYVKGVSGNRGPIILDYYKTAEGSATHDGFVNNSGVSYEIRISGEWKDVMVVLSHLEDALGARTLNPKPMFLHLPDLSGVWERIQWLYRWIRFGNK